jgi:hypothetical protein
MMTTTSPLLRAAALATGVLITVSLAACSQTLRPASPSFDVGITPNPLGFSVNATTQGLEYIIPSHVFSFSSRPGALGVTIEGYDIEFYEASGNPAFPGDFVQRSRGSLSVYVPPGLVCEGLREPDEEPAFNYCTVTSPGATFARGPERTSAPSSVLPRDVASRLYELVGVGGAVGAYAHLYFYGTDDLQRPFRTDAYRFAIQIPLGD